MRSLVTVAVLATLVPIAAAAEDMQPGQYRTRATSDVPGDTPEEDTQCVTQKDIDSGLTRLGVEKERGCKAEDFKRGPGSVSYRVVCGGAGPLNTMQVAATFNRDTFDLKMQVQLDPKGKPNTIRISGKRIGLCTDK